MRHFLSRSPLFLTLIACLFIVPACDSGGSNSDDGGNDDVAGSADLSEPNAFELNFSASSSSTNSLKAEFAKAASKYQGYAFQWLGSTDVDGTTKNYYALFFTSNKDFDSNTAPKAEVFGGLIGEFSKLPDEDTYTVGSTGSQTSPDFFGWIGQDFDTGPDGTRTLQILTDGKIEIGRDSNGNLVVEDFIDTKVYQYTVDFQDGEAQSVETQENVSVTLNGSIAPSEVNSFTEGEFSFTFSGSGS